MKIYEVRYLKFGEVRWFEFKGFKIAARVAEMLRKREDVTKVKVHVKVYD